MIDLITINTKRLSTDEINSIVEKNNLQTNSKDGVVFYDNLSTKNLRQQKGVFIKIETNGRLKLECSLHKYYNEITEGIRNNHNLFTMSQAVEAITTLAEEKGLSEIETNVYNYEIGLNLNVAKDCKKYLEKIRSIGAVGNERQMYINPKYKDERALTTVFHTSARKYFKVYDKVFESIDNKRRVIPDGNMLRIETVNRRLNNVSVADFFSKQNLCKLIDGFFKDWRTLQFEQDIVTPKGTGRAKRQICIDVLRSGEEATIAEAIKKHKQGIVTDWELRNIKEFIKDDWKHFKKHILFIQSEEEKEYRKLLQVNYAIINNDEKHKIK